MEVWEESMQPRKDGHKKPIPNLIYYNRLPKGGHFASWEQPC